MLFNVSTRSHGQGLPETKIAPLSERLVDFFTYNYSKAATINKTLLEFIHLASRSILKKSAYYVSNIAHNTPPFKTKRPPLH